MRHYVVYVCFLMLLLSCSLASAQKINFNRYASAWVKSTTLHQEENLIKENLEIADLKANGIVLYIPDNPHITMPNGNKFIQVYLMNNTNDTVTINRIDATIGQIETEVKVGNEWKLFQRNSGSSCGNSYFKAKLKAHNYYNVEIQNDVHGNMNVPFRVVVHINDQRIVSNETTTQVSKDLLELAGTPIQAMAF